MRKASALVVFALMVGTAPLPAQEYFGRNKVQYKRLDFQVLKTEHFDIYFYPSERDGIDIAARLAERWNARLERLLLHTLEGRQPLVLYGSHADFEQTNTIQGEMGEGTGGVTEPLKRRIILPLGGPIADTDHVIGHELVHAFQFDMTAGPNMGPGENGAERLPLWFIEGMAEYLSLGPVDPNTAMWLRDAARDNKLPSIDDLDNPKYFPYRWGQAFWAYVGGTWGDAAVAQLLRAAASSDTSTAIKRVLGRTTKELTGEWHRAIRTAYDPVLDATTPPSEIGRLTIKATGLGGDLNVGPSISPDGRWIAFLSTRSVFSIDLFIADTATGKILRRLTSTATDPHYSSIQFIYSAGAWDAQSKRIAIATVVSGRPVLAVFDAASGSKVREIPLPTLDEIFNPTWAPDGHAVCFTGMARGVTDLYVIDFGSGAVKPLTHDAYADLQPAWSPDGTRIAFVTDRYSSNLETLEMGAYRIAIVDPETGTIEQLRAFAGGKNIDPQWAPDGRGIYFISDRDGIANLYRVAVSSGDIAQLTRVGTGISGITATSPALSVASVADVAAFSVYEGGKYDIFTLALGEASYLKALTPAGTRAATLPPLERKVSDVAALLANPREGLPASTDVPPQVTKYTPKWSLLGVGQPSVGVGVSRYGTSVGGGISAYFGDMLGDHQLAMAASFSSIGSSISLKNTAAQVAYINQARRWNWGIVGGQVPYLTSAVAEGVATVGGEPALVDETIVYRQTERSTAGLLAYPLNRSQRLEFQAGASQLSFDQIVQTQAYSLTTGQQVVNTHEESPLASPMTLGTSSAALVSDTSNFGATSPVQGSRYRLEASPTFGTLHFTSVVADYRRYFMPAPFYTLAVRGLHYGRYGSGSDDPRLFPLYLGYPTFVRGYDLYSYEAKDCLATATSSCPALDRLYGSRLLVGNIEFRFPLLRPFGASQRMYGPVPLEVGVFADGGVAWNSLTAPVTGAVTTTVLGRTIAPHPFNWRDGVSSAGVALRVNLFGFAVGEFDFVRPFQRPTRGWTYQFNLTPGF